MAWITKLPSGLYMATVYTPHGRRTKTHELRGMVANWAGELEANIRRGEFIDPKLAKTTVAAVWERYAPARRIEKASRARDESHWRCWVGPRWGPVEVGEILKPDVQTWVNELEEDGVGGWTIIAAVNVLKAALELAVDAGMIRANPARRVKTPLPPEHVDRVFTAEEERLLLERLDELFPGRRDARLFVEGLFESGARWEEVAAVSKERVDLRRGLFVLGPVMERDGTVRDYPKGARSRRAAGFRDAPLGTEYLARLRPLVLATEPGALVFTAPQGGSMLYPTWLRRVWKAAMRVPVLGEDGKPATDERGRPMWMPLVADPQPTPHDCRHSFGTRLAEAGVPDHDRMALMGHKDHRSAARYTHSSDERHNKARAALRAARGG
jgi:integrase